MVGADGQVDVHLSAKAKKRLDATIRDLTPRTWGQSLQACIDRVSRYLAGWISHFQLCTEDGAALLARFDAHIRRRLRMIAVRQKKRPRYLVRHLVARGVRPRTAKLTAYCGRGLWYRSNHAGVTRAYPNAWFHGRLVSLAGRWRDLHPVRQVSLQLSLDL